MLPKVKDQTHQSFLSFPTLYGVRISTRTNVMRSIKVVMYGLAPPMTESFSLL